MKSHKLFLIFTMLASVVCFSQGEANNWYFGKNAGLNFNSGSPTVIYDGQLSTEEGCSSISTPFGELLFYTDGMNVYDKSHQIMPNGTGLYGNISSTQSSIIIPKPGSSSIYYIFTVPNLGTGALRYSEVDMELNNGLGDVNEVKNISLINPVCEKLTVVRNSEGNGFWVITHGYTGIFSDTGDSFFSFSVTSDGVDPDPVISQVGTVIDGLLYHTIGYLKVSPNGKKIIAANYGVVTELFDFNRETGQITNPVVISNNHASYGVEFSLSGDLVYLTTGDAVLNELHQYDLTADDIPTSKKIIHTEPAGGEMYALQMAPDSKIYVAMFNTNYLSVINNPEVLGTGCNFTRNSIDVSPAIVMSGLPQFNQSYFYGSILANNLCLGSPTEFEFLSDIEINTIHWDFGDGNTSELIAPSHQYENVGNYTVTLTATSNDGTIAKQKDISIYAPAVLVDESLDVVLCGGDGYTIDLKQFDDFYLDQQTSPSYGISYFSSYEKALNDIEPIIGNYNLTIGELTIYAKIYHLENEDCAVISDFKINLYSAPKVTLLNDIFICDTSSNNGVGVFDLSPNNVLAVNQQNSDSFEVSYHISQSEADLGENDLDESFVNNSNPQPIFARIYNVNHPECYVTSSFNIGFYKMPIANEPPVMFGCSDENGSEFDFALQIPFVLQSQDSEEFDVTFHKNFDDAANGDNATSLLYVSYASNETIFVRVSNKLNYECYDISNFEIFSKEKPILNLDEVYAICEGDEFVKISLPLGYSSYLWSNGEVSNEANIDEVGSHYVIVTADYGDVLCSTTVNFEVRNSSPATIKSIEIKDWNGRENSLLVYSEGAGEYQYSLDGINFQDNPSFDNLPAGEYTVFVKDIFGCGIVKEIIFLLDYPRFFTPNSDGYNDFWSIKFSPQEEPDLEVLIFDRYGKFLKKFTGAEGGWDGTFEGRNLPSDDYWFLVKRESGIIYKGHFTLKR